MGYCFVIQPFSEPYNGRYLSIYKPAIEKAGLTAMRVDLDRYATNIPESIFEDIKMADICLADISEDRPNVWFEVGFATNFGDVVLICDKNKRDKAPFDVCVNNIYFYIIETDDIRYYDRAINDIADKIKAYLEIKAKKALCIDSGTKESLKENCLQAEIRIDSACDAIEKELLYLIICNSAHNSSVDFYDLRYAFEESGNRSFDFNIALNKLIVRGFIEKNEYERDNGAESSWIKLTPKGQLFALENEFSLRCGCVPEIYTACPPMPGSPIPPPPLPSENIDGN